MYRYSSSTGGFYRTEIHGDAIPEDAIDVSDEQHEALLAGSSAGLTIAVVDGSLQLVEPEPIALDVAKATLCRAIDAAADAVYVAIGGPSPGRMAEYQQAKADALAFQAAGYTGTTPPTIGCWADAQAWTAQQACDDILATAAQWEGALVSIRTARLTGKAAVNAAPDAGTAQATASAIIAGIQSATGAA